jgi:hypothetical protein
MNANENVMSIVIITLLLLALGGYLLFSFKQNAKTKNKNNPLDSNSNTDSAVNRKQQ